MFCKLVFSLFPIFWHIVKEQKHRVAAVQWSDERKSGASCMLWETKQHGQSHDSKSVSVWWTFDLSLHSAGVSCGAWKQWICAYDLMTLRHLRTQALIHHLLNGQVHMCRCLEAKRPQHPHFLTASQTAGRLCCLCVRNGDLCSGFLPHPGDRGRRVRYNSTTISPHAFLDDISGINLPYLKPRSRKEVICFLTIMRPARKKKLSLSFAGLRNRPDGLWFSYLPVWWLGVASTECCVEALCGPLPKKETDVAAFRAAWRR